MEDRMHNKRQISCHAFMKVLEMKWRLSLLLQAVALKKFFQRNICQMAELRCSAKIVFLRLSQPSLYYTLYWKQHSKKINLQCLVPTMIARAYCTSNHDVYPYSKNQRNIMHLNVRTEVTAVWQLEQYKCHSTYNILSF